MKCTCGRTEPARWTRYGDAVEPGSAYIPDPLCPEHFPAAATIVEVPSMWVVWLNDPSGTYGKHKAFFAHGVTADEAEQVALLARPGSTIAHKTEFASGPRRWREETNTGRVIENLPATTATESVAS